jgi:hypothetical protein
MISLFFSYAHEDEYYRDELATHLAVMRRSGLIRMWHDRQIPAGANLDGTIDQNLERADVILLLISPYFLASDYCYEKEGQRALEKAKDGSAVAIPVILQFSDWQNSPFGKLRVTPRDGAPIATFANIHEAFGQVAEDIRAVAEQLGKDETVARDIDGEGAKQHVDLTGQTRGIRVSIQALEQRNGFGHLLPTDLAAAFGELGVVARVEWGGNVPAEVTATITTPRGSIAQRTVVDPNASGAESTIHLTLNTHAFNAVTGVPALSNGPMVLSVTARASNNAVATTSMQGALANIDSILPITSFSPYNAPDGVPILTKTVDKYGRVWRHGNVVISALPIMYSGRAIASVSITISGATIPTQTITAPPYSAVWSASHSMSGRPSVAAKRLVHPFEFESNGITPKGITPSIRAVDTFGRDLGLLMLAVDRDLLTFRLDNTP